MMALRIRLNWGLNQAPTGTIVGYVGGAGNGDNSKAIILFDTGTLEARSLSDLVPIGWRKIDGLDLTGGDQ